MCEKDITRDFAQTAQEKAYVARERTVEEALLTQIIAAERSLKGLRDLYHNLPRSYLSRPASSGLFG